ncbi:MAG: hypothetical protein ACM3PZ_00035 [Bacillota bacterium]
MNQKLITIGLSADIQISKDVIRHIGKLSRTIAPQINEKNIKIISTEDDDSKACSEMIRQILKSMNRMDMFIDLGSENTISYQGDSTEILKYDKWRKYIIDQLKRFELLVLVCKDSKSYGTNPLKVNKGLDFPGLPVEFQPLDLLPIAS